MITDSLLDILRCPQDGSRLRLAAAELVAAANGAIQAGRLKNVGGETLTKPLDGALVREAGDLLYPILDQIPVMLPDEAISLRAIGR